MTKSKRILIAGIVIEALLAAIGIWLLMLMASGTLTPATSIDDARATIFAVIGTAMGGLGGIVLVAWTVARRRGA